MASVGTQKNKISGARKLESVATASLSTYNQSPRKVRLVTDLIKGKTVADAIVALTFLPKRASLPIKKLIESAVANAKAKGEDEKALRVADIRVDSAGMLVRFMPRAMGRAAPIRKRRSQVIVELSSIAPKVEKTVKKTKITKAEPVAAASSKAIAA
jgi:large subunit ribosomal protein L22